MTVESPLRRAGATGALHPWRADLSQGAWRPTTRPPAAALAGSPVATRPCPTAPFSIPGPTSGEGCGTRRPRRAFHPILETIMNGESLLMFLVVGALAGW